MREEAGITGFSNSRNNINVFVFKMAKHYSNLKDDFREMRCSRRGPVN